MSEVTRRDIIWRWLEEHGFTYEVFRPCYKCRYWEPRPEDSQPELGMVGDCLRYPPVPIHSESSIGKREWAWPETGCVATCGEWRKRKEGKR